MKITGKITVIKLTAEIEAEPFIEVKLIVDNKKVKVSGRCTLDEYEILKKAAQSETELSEITIT